MISERWREFCTAAASSSELPFATLSAMEEHALVLLKGHNCFRFYKPFSALYLPGIADNGYRVPHSM